MKKSSVTRRKFLTGLGLTAGATAFVPTIKFANASPNQQRNLLDAWNMPPKNNIIMQPVKVISRKAGSYLLPLSSRPF